LYETEATKKIKENSKTDLEQFFNFYVQEVCELAGTTEFYKDLTQIHNDFCEHYKNKDFSIIEIKNFLQNEKKLTAILQRRIFFTLSKLEKAQQYTHTDTETGEQTVNFDIVVTENKSGRFYTLKKEDFF
jgi:hypothetical protein